MTRRSNIVLTAPDFLRLAVVRCPYTRVVSAWRNKVLLCEPGYEYVYRKALGANYSPHLQQPLGFEQFLNFVEAEEDLRICNPHWRMQVNLLLYPAISYTHVGKLEKLSETVRVIEAHLTPKTPLRLGRGNSTDGGAYKLTSNDAERIYNLYAADFEAFGYKADSWRDLNRERDNPGFVSESRFIDEVVERNLMISHLYEELARLEAKRWEWSRFLRAFLRRVWKGLFGRSRSPRHGACDY